MATRDMGIENFEATISQGGVVVVDAWAAWCGPCRAFAPIFEAAAARHDDIVWAKLDTARESELAHGLGIQAIPTLLVFRDGILLFKRAGMLPGKALDDVVEQAKRLDMEQVRRQLSSQSRDSA